MELEFTSKNIEIYTKSKDTYCMVIRRYPRIATKVNQFLKFYQTPYVFNMHEDYRFVFTKDQIESIASLGSRLTQIFTQIRPR